MNDPKQPTEAKSALSIAVLISGGGRTLENFLQLIESDQLDCQVKLVISSTTQAKGLQFAEQRKIATAVIERQSFSPDADGDQQFGNAIFDACRQADVQFVAMAGFLKFAPIPTDFTNRVVNIHPSLIPSFCGTGMYGHHVHQAVLDYGAKVTGCTVHFVDNQYDHGPIIWQQPVPVFDDDTPDSLASRVFEVEKEAYPHVLSLIAAGRISISGRQVRIVNSRGRSASKPSDS